jgi:DinB superfamily
MTTAAVTPAAAAELEILREQSRVIHRVLHLNTEGLTQEDSLIQPQPGGNCLNWVVGHLVNTYDTVVLPLLGEPPVLGKEALKRYDRGSPPLREAGEALPLTELLAAWDEASSRVDAGLARVAPERLEQAAPFSPRKNPDETVRSLLTIVIFHQAYHVGQTALHRRMAGKEGAIK